MSLNAVSSLTGADQHPRRDKQQDKANQANGVWVSRYRLLLLEDKSGFPRKAAMNLFCACNSLCYLVLYEQSKKSTECGL
ncbi:hypothetical protein A136_20130 [Vibrio crassostreae 9ZC13]|nr:hypothetical protein A136_20130 [Vibrio crassostreae 9ZC13]